MVFKDQIKELGDANGMTGEETIEKLKLKYDGYHFSKRLNDIFNPFSILNCFSKNDFQDFWFATGTPTYLMRLMADCDETKAPADDLPKWIFYYKGLQQPASDLPSRLPQRGSQEWNGFSFVVRLFWRYKQPINVAQRR